MEGVNAFQLPKRINKTTGQPEYPEIIDIAGFAYLYYPEAALLCNLQAVSEKFKTWEEVKIAIEGV